MKSIREKQLIIPALIVLSNAEGYITTKELKTGILKLVRAKKADKEFVGSRKQTLIGNRIENLISHKTLSKWADYNKMDGKSYIKINSKGKTYISQVLLGIEA